MAESQSSRSQGLAYIASKGQATTEQATSETLPKASMDNKARPLVAPEGD